MTTLRGLSTAQVLLNRSKYGENIIPKQKLKTPFDFFMEMFHSKINIILLVLMFICIGLALIGYGTISEPLGIGIVLIIVGFLETVTKVKSQKYTSELQDKISEKYCNVIRNSKVVRINTKKIVVGDIVILETGDTIPADGFMVSGKISVNNAILNGESAEVCKTPIPNYKYNPNALITSKTYLDKNSVFSGTSVQSGLGRFQVTNVGIHTQNAQTLLSMRNVTETKTSLHIQLDNLANKISKLGYIGATFIFAFLLFAGIHNNINGFLSQPWQVIARDIISYLTVAITVIVAAVPEGLPVIIELITAQNTRAMVKRNILAKNTSKIPEAGNIQILCTDKTGTLTYGKLTPVKNYLGNGHELDFLTNAPANKLFLQSIVLNNAATFDADGSIIGGNSTERALLSIITNPRDALKIKKSVKIINRKPFNSADKFSGIEIKSGVKTFSYYKGAPEFILKHATKYIDSDGKIKTLNKAVTTRILNSATKQAMRVIATGYTNSALSSNKIPSNLILISLTCIRDDVRTEVPAAVELMKSAGIQTIMITGDNINTATAIATDCGILTSNMIAMTADELNAMSDREIVNILNKISVIARATPETKLRLVNIAQSQKLCIGMCGDGTNDAPALRKADVGFAMGSGTDVCKEACDIIIIDDNYVSIVNAVLFGRTFMHNVEKFLRFQLPINFALLMTSLLFPLLLGIEAFSATQILIINIIMDSLNSLAFGAERPRNEYMREKPIAKGSAILNYAKMKSVILNSMIFTTLIFATYLPFIQNIFNFNEQTLMSGRFALLIIMSVFNGFNIRQDKINILYDLKNSPMFVIIAISIFIGTFWLTNFGGSYFNTIPLNTLQWLTIIGLSFIVIPLDMIRKSLRRGL